MEVGAGEEQRDASAAEGPEGTDSQSAVSMAVLWKPGSAAQRCSGWNFNVPRSPGTRETANPQTKSHPTCRCLIRTQFLIQPAALPAPLGEERMSKHKSVKIRTCYTPVALNSIWALQNSFGGSNKFVKILEYLILCYMWAADHSLEA